MAGPFWTAPLVLNRDPWQGHTNACPLNPVIVQLSCVQVAVTAVKVSAPVWATRMRPFGLWTRAALPTDARGEPASMFKVAPPLAAVALRVASAGTSGGSEPPVTLPPPPPQAWSSVPTAAAEANWQAWVQNSRRVCSVMAYGLFGPGKRFPFVNLPNLEALSARAAFFERAMVTTSLCSPSRATLLSGLYAHTHGVPGNESTDISPDIETYPQILRASGYETAYVGKWHMPVLNVPFRLIYAWNPSRDPFQPARTFKFAVGTTF